ncbi:hypothetical protein [Corynebacterium sp.]|uniref:hypothetical protein n=1 Tax=Corynebacterium sp. TaxID=1720 RepID=UPI003B3A70E1
MSQRNDPRPLPPEVYRRRRITAVVVLVVVVALLWWVISSLAGGDDGQDQVATTGESSAVSSPSGTTPESSGAAESTEASGSTSRSAEPSESSERPEPSETEGVPDEVASKRTCELDDLQLSVRPGAPTFRDGQQPNFFLEVTNPTSGECDIDLSEDELKFEVFTMDSGYTRVWGDTDCNSPTSTGRLRLEPDQSRTFEMTAWSRTTSSPDSCDSREPVGNGAYMVYGHIGDKTSESQTFNLA